MPYCKSIRKKCKNLLEYSANKLRASHNPKTKALIRDIESLTLWLDEINPPLKFRIKCIADNIQYIPPCPSCGNPVRIEPSYKISFSKFCSKKCQSVAGSKLNDTEYDTHKWLYEQRINKHLSLEAISELCCVSVTVIGRLLKKHKIPDVKYNESSAVAKAYLKDKEWLTKKHKDEHLTCNKIGELIGCSGSLVSIWLANHAIEDNARNSYDRIFNRISREEKSLGKFLHDNYNGEIIHSNRSVLDGLELDFYLPELNLAFEYNGVLWHSEKFGKKDRNYHFNKTKKCLEKEIHLFHIFSDDWLYRTDIWKSRILYLLRSPKTIPLNARQCEIKEITTSEKNTFLDFNHLQGRDRANIKIGLYYKEELAAVMTFIRARFSKKYEWELSRFACLLNHNVRGGFQKLLVYFIRNYNPSSVVSYADC